MLKLIFLIFILDFIWDLFNVLKGCKKERYLSKSLLMPLLLIFYILYSKNINYFVVAALSAGFLGDVFLLSDKPYSLIIGGTSFLLGHIFYIISYIGILSKNPKLSPYLFILIIPYILYGIYAYKIIGNKMGNLKLASLPYIIIILLASIICLFTVLSSNHNFIISLIGTLLFIASDSILGYRMFISKKKYLDFLVMLTYVIAQTFIVFGFLGI
ncbi:MAG: lysoplasmalogenase [Caloramator sp.]|nr:lysoplasmalogenase [Caloramator sp.]